MNLGTLVLKGRGLASLPGLPSLWLTSRESLPHSAPHASLLHWPFWGGTSLPGVTDQVDEQLSWAMWSPAWQDETHGDAGGACPSL